MSKISLKNILKKTFKNKSQKIKKKKVLKNKITGTKKILPKKSKKNPIKSKSLKSGKNILQKKVKKVDNKIEAKSDNLRIPKSNEVKPEIKKVKKQSSEKREYKIKD